MRRLAIKNLGMVSSLALGAEATASAMRCSYEGFIQSHFINPLNNKHLITAEIPHYHHLRGEDKLAEMAKDVIAEATKGEEITGSLPLVLCLQSTELESYYNTDTFISDLSSHFSKKKFSTDSTVIRKDKVGFNKSLEKAEALLYNKGYPFVLLLCIDSYISNKTLTHFLKAGFDYPRINDEENHLGFTPGEAAVAILLTRPSDDKNETCITGIGYGTEEVTIESNEVFKAEGLSDAIRHAVNDAGIRVCDTNFRISSVNGESYYFKEAGLAIKKTLEEKVESHSLWHPADNIGDVGASMGGAMVVMGYYAFKKSYAPGQRALCQLSNDNKSRAAFILERMGDN